MARICIYTFIGLVLLACRMHCARRVDASTRLTKALAVREAQSPLIRSLGDRMTVRDLLGLDQDTELKEVEEAQTVQGTRIVKVVETYKGYPVFNEALVVETDSEGREIIDARGTFLEGIQEDMANEDWRISPEEALSLVLRESRDEDLREKITNVVVTKELFPTNSNHVVPGYYVQYLLATGDRLRKPTAIVDANSRTVLRIWDGLESFGKPRVFGGNKKIGKIDYGKYGYLLNLRREGDICFMENDFVRVIDNNHTEDPNYPTEPISFPCSDGYDDKVNGAFSPALDALFYGTLFGKMLKDWYNATALKNKIELRVHYGLNEVDAAWDGDVATFGDGDGTTFHPLVSLDVVAHEIGHGMVNRYSCLVYEHQSGGIDEAFSDISGQVLEQYLGETDWMALEDIRIDQPAERYFDDPRKDGKSIRSLDQFKPCMDPHYSSGVYNYMYYLLVNNYSLNVQETYGVFLQANRFYWHNITNMTSGACDLLAAAYNLGQPMEEWRNAMTEVAIIPCDVSKHVRTLRRNEIYPSITVSKHKSPLFQFYYEGWMGEITVEVVKGSDVHVQLLREDCNGLATPECVLDDGILEAGYNFGGTEGKMLIRLYTDSTESVDVELIINVTVI